MIEALTVKQSFLVSILGNVLRTVRRICLLMLGCKGLKGWWRTNGQGLRQTSVLRCDGGEEVKLSNYSLFWYFNAIELNELKNLKVAFKGNRFSVCNDCQVPKRSKTKRVLGVSQLMSDSTGCSQRQITHGKPKLTVIGDLLHQNKRS